MMMTVDLLACLVNFPEEGVYTLEKICKSLSIPVAQTQKHGNGKKNEQMYQEVKPDHCCAVVKLLLKSF